MSLPGLSRLRSLRANDAVFGELAIPKGQREEHCKPCPSKEHQQLCLGLQQVEQGVLPHRADSLGVLGSLRRHRLLCIGLQALRQEQQKQTTQRSEEVIKAWTQPLAAALKVVLSSAFRALT